MSEFLLQPILASELTTGEAIQRILISGKEGGEDFGHVLDCATASLGTFFMRVAWLKVEGQYRFVAQVDRNSLDYTYFPQTFSSLIAPLDLGEGKVKSMQFFHPESAPDGELVYINLGEGEETNQRYRANSVELQEFLKANRYTISNPRECFASPMPVEIEG